MSAIVSDLLKVRSLFVEGLLRYLKVVREWPDTAGHWGGRTAAKMYIEPQLKQGTRTVNWKQWQQELREPGRRIPLLGRVGQGKTLLAQMSAWYLAKLAYRQLDKDRFPPEKLVLPVYLPLPRVEKSGSLEVAVEKYLMFQWEKIFPAVHNPGIEKITPKVIEFIKESLYTERCFLFLDELHGCHQLDQLPNLLNSLTHDQTQSSILLAIRSDSLSRDLVRHLLGSTFSELEISS